jgi:hypothetical protein
MPEVPNAYKCDYCRVIMVPIEKKDERWHTKWCSACGAKLFDLFIGEKPDKNCCFRVVKGES